MNTNRSTVLVILIAAVLIFVLLLTVRPDRENEKPVVVRAQNYLIRATETQYTCFTVSVLPAGERIYVTGFAPAIDPTDPAANHIHHYVVSIADPGEQVGTRRCRGWPGNPILAWTLGMPPLIFPEDVSMALGGEEETLLTLQVHYHNPQGIEGIIDTNGIEVLYTTEPRPIEAGMLTIGSVFDIEVPNGSTVDFAAPRCTAADTAKIGPINVFASWLHAHEIAKTLWTNHYRDGKLLGDLNREEHFEFETQRFVAGDWQVLPGDELEVHCDYENQTGETVRGGAASSEEMCLNFMLYYPSTSYEFCGGRIENPKTSGLL